MTASSAASEISRLDAVTLARRIRTRGLSAVEATEAALARREATEPHLHAFCTPAPDLARETAHAIDRRIAAGDDMGPLAGVPVGIKDLVATKGLRTAMGSPLYRDFVPDEDDIVVERLKAAGAVILGKTNVPELGYSGVGHSPIAPTTRTPWARGRPAGGSRGGVPNPSTNAGTPPALTGVTL